MLTAKENKALTEVGSGKPMGEFMRRYWIPAAKSEEVPSAGGAPARVKLLGEHLVLFRSRDGELGLIDEFCPHRRASLVYGAKRAGRSALPLSRLEGCVRRPRARVAARAAGAHLRQEAQRCVLSGARGRRPDLDLYGTARA